MQFKNLGVSSPDQAIDSAHRLLSSTLSLNQGQSRGLGGSSLLLTATARLPVVLCQVAEVTVECETH